MTAIEKYVEAMENKDYAGLANLFSPHLNNQRLLY